MTDNITARVPVALRDGDGVRLDAMLEGAGARIIREQPRSSAPSGWVDLLLEHTSAPAAIRGQVVTPVFDEIDTGAGMELSFDRWQQWGEDMYAAEQEIAALQPDGPN